MNIIILTSSRIGTASYHLSSILQKKAANIAMVVLNENQQSNKKKHFLRKLKKVVKIGIAGALNGFRIRKWYIDYELQIEQYQDIENICKKNNIPFYTTPQINCETTIDLFKKANADLGISLGNGYIGSKIFTLPRLGMINIHHEILPEYQNAQSVLWQIYNMSTFTGYTIHRINKGIDTGDIIFQEKIPIIFKDNLKDTVSTTYLKLIKTSAVGLTYLLQNFESKIANATKQEKGRSYTTPSIWEFWRIKQNFKKLKINF